MSHHSTFVRTHGDARAIEAAHRRHRGTPHFGCPLCVVAARRDSAPSWTSPRRG